MTDAEKAKCITPKTHAVVHLDSLGKVLAFAANKEIVSAVDDLYYYVCEKTLSPIPSDFKYGSVVFFADGSALACFTTEDYGYSELTPGSGAGTCFYGYTPR